MAETSTDRHVHWNDQSSSVLAIQAPQRISVNASLPYHSKLNIRIQSHRRSSNEDLTDVRTTARIERLDLNDDHDHQRNLRQIYRDHYATLSTQGTDRGLAIYDEQFRQVSIPVSLPMDHRLHLYLRNGEVLARC